jgi:hypothetical protein
MEAATGAHSGLEGITARRNVVNSSDEHDEMEMTPPDRDVVAEAWWGTISLVNGDFKSPQRNE